MKICNFWIDVFVYYSVIILNIFKKFLKNLLICEILVFFMFKCKCYSFCFIFMCKKMWCYKFVFRIDKNRWNVGCSGNYVL